MPRAPQNPSSNFPPQLAPDPANGGDPSGRLLRVMFRSMGAIRHLMAPFFEAQGLSAAQWVVLCILIDREEINPEPIRLVDLSGSLAIRPPTLTAVINKLVGAGLIERTAVTGERRGWQVRLSAKGRALHEKVMVNHHRQARLLLDVWKTNEKEQILGLFEMLWNHLERMRNCSAQDQAVQNHVLKEQTRGS
jgi:DNA-binding MarR family transcriptional regulator